MHSYIVALSSKNDAEKEFLVIFGEIAKLVLVFFGEQEFTLKYSTL
jgi:hypothetical protein